jgi:L-lactate dehydrogenase complex protein LldG
LSLESRPLEAARLDPARLDPASLEEAFATQAARIGATVQRLSPTGLAEAVTQKLRAAGCRSVALAAAVESRAALAEALVRAGFDLIEPAVLLPTQRADAGLSQARLGVAETGSLLLHSTPADRRVELCVDLHLVVLPASALVPTLDQACAALREISARPPAYASLVSGPSRSADIERTLTIGVHGPRALHVLLIEAAE